MSMNFNIKFHPVGFGLFTSGEIGNFKFVYDCGSTSTYEVNKCIDKEFAGCKRLNLLVISHFHGDHISGIKRLIEVVDHIDTIVLPYITPRERLNYLLTLRLNSEDFEWIRDFIIDPANSLIEFENKISKIAFIKGGSENYLDIHESEDIGRDDIDDINDEVGFNVDILEPANDERDIKSIEEILDTENKVSIRKHGLVPLTSGNKRLWQFIFYYCKQSENIEKYFKKIGGCLGFTSDMIEKKDLKSIVDDAKFSKIAKSNKVRNSDINNTSLLLYHSPIGKYDMADSGYWGRLFRSLYYFNCHQALNNLSGFFYSGDVNLQVKREEIIRYYGKLICQVSVFQVPHHGSINNWDSFLSSNNPEMIHIISSKFDNPKGLHPNPKVLYQITKYQGIIIWCNEEKEVIIHGYVLFK